MAQAISIPAATFRAKFQEMGFEEKATPPSRYSSGEVYFEKPFYGNSQLVIKVYSSLSVGAMHTRSAGEDAIQVCLVWRYNVWESQSVGLIKTVRVNRVGTIESTMARMFGRIRDTNRKAVELNLGEKCLVCGCPLYPTTHSCRNRNCGKAVTPRQQPRVLSLQPKAAGTSARLNSAFGSAHSPMTQAVAARTPVAPRVRPVAPAQAIRKVEAEASRNQVEEPVLSNADMPADMRNLF